VSFLVIPPESPVWPEAGLRGFGPSQRAATQRSAKRRAGSPIVPQEGTRLSCGRPTAGADSEACRPVVSRGWVPSSQPAPEVAGRGIGLVEPVADVSGSQLPVRVCGEERLVRGWRRWTNRCDGHPPRQSSGGPGLCRSFPGLRWSIKYQSMPMGGPGEASGPRPEVECVTAGTEGVP